MNIHQQDLTDTIVALATPPGIGAIGVIRLSGKEAINICNKSFISKDLSKVKSHTIHLGTIRNEENIIIDEVLVSVFVSPKSYTGENVVEVSCHGSTYILQQIIELFLRQGARMANPGEFTLRAFLNGKMDLSQAEAVADLISSTSSAAHEIAIKQMRGEFSLKIKFLRQKLIDFASLIELELDFGEEDVEFANREDLRALVSEIQELLTRLIHSFQLGNVIKNGVTTVIAGRPNAGKSTLLNTLLNEERAIVSEIAGTTRDTIEEVLNIEGIEFRLIDTAGIREATDKIEAIGVSKTLEKVKTAAILVYVFDVIETLPPTLSADLKQLHQEGMTTILIANKMDVLHTLHDNTYDYFQKRDKENGFTEIMKDLEKKYKTIYLSAKNEADVLAIKKALLDTVVSGATATDNTVVSNARHYQALGKANESLAAVLEGLKMDITGDFLAQDIRHALAHLGEITGEISTDDLLGNIFSNFCIGK